MDDALAEQAEAGLKVCDFGMELGCICSCFSNGLEEEGFCKGFVFHWGSEEADSSCDFDWEVVLVDREGVDCFFD